MICNASSKVSDIWVFLFENRSFQNDGIWKRQRFMFKNEDIVFPGRIDGLGQ